jgi:hypothetical protein
MDDLERYREAMRRLRGPVGPDRGELPRDPDWDAVPPGLEELDGRRVTVSGIDRNTGELVHMPGELAVVPGISGDVTRRERG